MVGVLVGIGGASAASAIGPLEAVLFAAMRAAVAVGVCWELAGW
jgi:hypothetical protein